MSSNFCNFGNCRVVAVLLLNVKSCEGQAEVISKFLGNDVHWPAMTICEKDIPAGYDKAHDKKHPGPRANRSFADDVIARYSNFLKS